MFQLSRPSCLHRLAGLVDTLVTGVRQTYPVVHYYGPGHHFGRATGVSFGLTFPCAQPVVRDRLAHLAQERLRSPGTRNGHIIYIGSESPRVF